MWKNWHSNNFEKQKVEKLMSQIRYILAAIDDGKNMDHLIFFLPPWFENAPPWSKKREVLCWANGRHS